MTLLPLGTILKINKSKMFIIGYTSVEKNDSSVLGYFVVSYPLGFTNIDKTFFVPYDLDFEILSKGYSTKASDNLLKVMMTTFENVKTIDYEKFSKLSDFYKEKAISERAARKQ